MRAAAARALELDDTLPVTHGGWPTLSATVTGTGQGRSGSTCARSNSIPTAPRLCAATASSSGRRQRHEEALVMLRKALELDPFSLDVNWFIGWVYCPCGASTKQRRSRTEWCGWTRTRGSGISSSRGPSRCVAGGPTRRGLRAVGRDRRWSREPVGALLVLREVRKADRGTPNARASRAVLTEDAHRPAHVVGPRLRWRRGRRAGARLHDAGARGTTHAPGAVAELHRDDRVAVALPRPARGPRAVRPRDHARPFRVEHNRRVPRDLDGKQDCRCRPLARASPTRMLWLRDIHRVLREVCDAGHWSNRPEPEARGVRVPDDADRRGRGM